MISSLVTSPSERSGGGGNMTLRAIGRVGQAVNVAVDRFVTVGETIADDNPEIKVDMYEACKEARAAGLAIEKLCETAETNVERPSPVGVGAGSATGMVGGSGVSQEYRATMIRAARCLLSSVTRVLLLADTVVVKQLLLTKDKVSHSLSRLESVTNFTEFVKAFSQFGAEMVELAQLTNDRQTDLKDERRRAQMAAARQVLDRSTMMLLTASKVCLRHPECMTSRENRDTVFCQMRRAMDLIHYVVKDGVLESCSTPGEARINGQSPGECPSGLRTRQEDWEANLTVYGAVKYLEESVEMTRVTLCGPAVRERLCQAIDTISERSQDFTDSAYTSHEHRQTILLLLDRIRLELNHLLRVGVSLEQREIPSPSDELESAISTVSHATKEFKNELQNTALEQGSEIVRGFCEESELISALKNAGLATDQERLDEYSDRFLEHIEHMQEVCKLLRHVASTDSLQVASKYGEINLRIYGPQVVTAAQTLCLYPTSKIAKENVEVFADMWLNLVGDIKSLTKEIGDQILADNKPPEKQVYMSLPRPGKHGTTTKLPKPTKLDQEEQAKLAKSGLDMKMISSEVDQEAEKWEEKITQDEDNDIVKRAKNMSSMAFSMYQFTRGEGPLKTTQDLFTQGEYFAEEANRLYKVVRQFSYQVPAGPQKKELMEHLDNIPTYVQSLQFTVKNPTVGKAATFTKVDNVIQETKSLMNVISKVVQVCFVCATKFSLKLPERLQLPTMEEVRSSGSTNPFGQVETASRDSSNVSSPSTVAGSLEQPNLRTLSPHKTTPTSLNPDQFIKPLQTRESIQQQSEQKQDNTITMQSEIIQLNPATRLDCNVNPETQTNTKVNFVVSSVHPSQPLNFQNCPVDVSPSITPQSSSLQSQFSQSSLQEQPTMLRLQPTLLEESQNSVSSLQNILNSLTLKYIQTQVSLEPLLDIQNTINFLKDLQNPQSSQKQEYEFQQGVELAIHTLLNAQPNQDFHTQATLESIIQMLQSLLLKHMDTSILESNQQANSIRDVHKRLDMLSTSSLDRKGKLHYSSTHSLTSDKSPSFLIKALLDLKSLPSANPALKSRHISNNNSDTKPNENSFSSVNRSPCLTPKLTSHHEVLQSPPLSPSFGGTHSFFPNTTSHCTYKNTTLTSNDHVPCTDNPISNKNNMAFSPVTNFQSQCPGSPIFSANSLMPSPKNLVSSSNSLISNSNGALIGPNSQTFNSGLNTYHQIHPQSFPTSTRELDIASSLYTPLFDLYTMQNSASDLKAIKTTENNSFMTQNTANVMKTADQYLFDIKNSVNVAKTVNENPYILQSSGFTKITDQYSTHKQNLQSNLSTVWKPTDQLQYLDLHSYLTTREPEAKSGNLWLKDNHLNLLSMASPPEINNAKYMLMSSQPNPYKYNSILTMPQPPSLSQSVQYNIQSQYKDLNFHSLTP